MKRLLVPIALLCATAAEAVPAYVVHEITVTDPAKFKLYSDKSGATLAPFGGHYVVRGGNGEAWSGDKPASRIVIMAFPDRAAAKAWHDSAAYQAILKIREASSTSRVYVVDGVAP